MPKNSGQVDIDERLQRIVDELSIAARWQRSLLVTVTCRSVITSREQEIRLEQELLTDEKPVLRYRVDRFHYDIPIALKEHLLSNQGIFMVRNLRQGGGRGYSNAYRALNMHREYLVEEAIKVIFWLTEGEARQLARHAPDFWAFRHLVVAFPELPANGENHAVDFPGGKETGESGHQLKGNELFHKGCYEEALSSYRRALKIKPGDAWILLAIARTQLAMQTISPARQTLRLAGRGNLLAGDLKKEYLRLESLLKSEQNVNGGFLEG